jgi:4-hydroxy-tetrahydrodipicolinate synthase
LLEVNNEMFIEVNPIPVKSAMAYYGFCTNEMRLPLTVIEPQHELVLHNALAKIKKGGKHETNNRRG